MLNKEAAADRWVTVWEFRTVDGRQVEIRERPAYPDDARWQHEYQRILYRGPRSKFHGLAT